jgi:hypothetical protein
VPFRVPHVVDGALSEHPLAQDVPPVPEPDVLAFEVRDVQRVKVRIVVEAEGEPGQVEDLAGVVFRVHQLVELADDGGAVALEPEPGPVEIVPLQPVRRVVRVGRRVAAGARVGEPGHEHGPHRLRQQARLVHVRAHEGQTADLLLRALVVRSADVDPSPAYPELAHAGH